MAYADQTAYPFYILHQALAAIIAYFIYQIPIGMFIKFVILTLGTFLDSHVGFEQVKRTALTRSLFEIESKYKVPQWKAGPALAIFKRKAQKFFSDPLA